MLTSYRVKNTEKIIRNNMLASSPAEAARQVLARQTGNSGIIAKQTSGPRGGSGWYAPYQYLRGQFEAVRGTASVHVSLAVDEEL